ncbi:MAG: S1 family peptidase [Acidobacteriota bacterium]
MTRMRMLCLGLALMVVVLAASPLSAQLVEFREEVAKYTALYGVHEAEALRRLQLQAAVGELDAKLMAEHGGAFAGLWIEHEPDFRVVVRFKAPHGRHVLDGLKLDRKLRPHLELRSDARYSREELKAAQQAAIYMARELGAEIDANLDVEGNRVELYSTDAAGLRGRLADRSLRLPAAVEVQAVEALAQPVELAKVYAGLRFLKKPLGNLNCTTGFAAFDNATRLRGILTAGHCLDRLYYIGTHFPMQREDVRGSQDIQWHRYDVYALKPWMQAANAIRPVSGTRHRNNQANGTFVCKHGSSTGFTCGTISGRDFAPGYLIEAEATFMLAEPGDDPLAQGGDSGGPVFAGEIAFGIVSGRVFDEMIYMAINFVDELDVTVMTGPLDPPPVTCTDECDDAFANCINRYCNLTPNTFMCTEGCELDWEDCMCDCGEC